MSLCATRFFKTSSPGSTKSEGNCPCLRACTNHSQSNDYQKIITGIYSVEETESTKGEQKEVDKAQQKYLLKPGHFFECLRVCNSRLHPENETLILKFDASNFLWCYLTTDNWLSTMHDSWEAFEVLLSWIVVEWNIKSNSIPVHQNYWWITWRMLSQKDTISSQWLDMLGCKHGKVDHSVLKTIIFLVKRL